ncbi:MAG: helix-turn-helix domain-containing protein [bacterium]|nr:helix-turn-helix domain-containing protein [bacterium]
MEVLDRLKELQKMYGWSDYKITKEAGLSDGAISNMYRRKTTPSLYTLQLICNAFGITLSQFFYDEKEDKNKDIVPISPELKCLIDNWLELSAENRELVLKLVQALH